MQRTGTRFLFALCAGLLAAAGWGCGSNQGCLDYAKASCQRQIECSALLGKLDSANLDACQASIAKSCELSTKSPDTNWKQETASACAQAISAATCDVILDGPRPAACAPPGNRSIGAPCAEGLQCSSLLCTRPTSHDCGTCAPLHKVGETCGSGSYCEAGLQCSGMGTCAPLRAEGEVCDANFGCFSRLACSGGTCQAAAIGQSCAGQFDYCSVDSLQGCEFNSMSCQPINYSVSQVGESCGIDQLRGTFVDCQPAAYCKTGSSGSFGVCTLLPKEGEPCATVNASGGAVYQFCLSPTTCISGTCQIFDRSSCN